MASGAPHTPPPARADLPALTGLRIVAAVMVYLSHLRQPTDIPHRLGTFMSSGYTGVTLFFVLSGFLLTLHHRDMPLSSAPRFWWARLARIYPLYAAVLAYVVVLMLRDGVALHDLSAHVLLLQAWYGNVLVAYGYIGPAWSLSVEVAFYLAFPVLVLAARRLRLGTATATVLGVAAALLAAAWWFRARGELTRLDPASAHRWLYQSPVARIGDFVIGMALAVIYRSVVGRRHAAVVGRCLAVTGALVTAVLMSMGRLLYTAWSWDAMYILPVSAIVLGLALGGSRVLGSGPIVAAGAASYAFYLIHTVVMTGLGADEWADMGARSLVAQVAILLLVLALSVGLHHMVEQPAHRWLRARVRPPERGGAPTPAATETPATSLH